jgi:hypothetical protein
VLDRRTSGRRAARPTFAASAGAALAAPARRLAAAAARHPMDSVAVLAAAAATIAIVVNALVLQSPTEQAPFVATAQPRSRPAAPPPAAGRPTTSTPVPAATTGSAHQTMAPSVSARHRDPIAELIVESGAASSRVLAVQRVLSAYGYGQITPSGRLDEPTAAAIKRFQSEHKLPATGRVSASLLTELSRMTGQPIE